MKTPDLVQAPWRAAARPSAAAWTERSATAAGRVVRSPDRLCETRSRAAPRHGTGLQVCRSERRPGRSHTQRDAATPPAPSRPTLEVARQIAQNLPAELALAPWRLRASTCFLEAVKTAVFYTVLLVSIEAAGKQLPG